MANETKMKTEQKNKIIFYDVDTQKDFMNQDGALYVPEAESIKPTLVRLTHFAKINNIPIVGSVDRHFGTEQYKAREGELQKWGGPFPDHCMNGSKGIERISETFLPDEQGFMGGRPPGYNGIFIEHNLDGHIDNIKLAYALVTITGYEEFGRFRNKCSAIFEKQSYDIFTNPAFEFFLKEAGVKTAVVYGVATDYCVKAAVLGMQRRGIQCYVMEDAIKGVAAETTNTAIKEMQQAGAVLTKTSELEKILQGKM